MIVIDANGMIVGRLGSFAAKKALLGNKIEIVNCENAIITGKKKFLIDEFKRKRDMGTHTKGPFLPKTADMILKKIIRGMLPYKQQKGRNAYARIRCYIGLPPQLENIERIRIEDADVSKVNNLDYLTLGEICRRL